MAVITSTACFIGKQDGGKNALRQNYRADRKISRCYRRVSRRGVVNESEGIGSIDGVHDKDAGYLRQFESTRLWLKILRHARDPTSLASHLLDRDTTSAVLA